MRKLIGDVRQWNDNDMTWRNLMATTWHDVTWEHELMITGNEMIMIWHDVNTWTDDYRKWNDDDMTWYEEINFW